MGKEGYCDFQNVCRHRADMLGFAVQKHHVPRKFRVAHVLSFAFRRKSPGEVHSPLRKRTDAAKAGFPLRSE